MKCSTSYALVHSHTTELDGIAMKLWELAKMNRGPIPVQVRPVGFQPVTHVNCCINPAGDEHSKKDGKQVRANNQTKRPSQRKQDQRGEQEGYSESLLRGKLLRLCAVRHEARIVLEFLHWTIKSNADLEWLIVAVLLWCSRTTCDHLVVRTSCSQPCSYSLLLLLIVFKRCCLLSQADLQHRCLTMKPCHVLSPSSAVLACSMRYILVQCDDTGIGHQCCTNWCEASLKCVYTYT